MAAQIQTTVIHTFKADAVGFVSLNERYLTRISLQLQTVIHMSLFPIRDDIQRRLGMKRNISQGNCNRKHRR